MMVDKITKIAAQTEMIQSVIDREVAGYFGNLDAYMAEIDKEFIRSGGDTPTNTLSEFLLNLNSLIYWAGTGLEVITIKSSLSRMAYDEIFNKKYNEAQGTIGDKKAMAALQAQEEDLVKSAYTSAVKLCQHKLERASELSASIKKVITYRMGEQKGDG